MASCPKSFVDTAHYCFLCQLRFALFHLEDVDKKILKQYEEDESDIDDEWIAEHEENLRELAKERVCANSISRSPECLLI